MIHRIVPAVGVLLAVGFMAPGPVAAADNQVFIDVPGLFSGFATVARRKGVMAQLLEASSPDFKLRTGELVLARPLGMTTEPVNAEWFDWRQAIIDEAGAGKGVDLVDVRIDIWGTDPIGKTKGPILIVSVMLQDAWPQEYRVVQVDEPAISPGGKGTTTVFEEILVLRFKRVIAPP